MFWLVSPELEVRRTQDAVPKRFRLRYATQVLVFVLLSVAVVFPVTLHYLYCYFCYSFHCMQCWRIPAELDKYWEETDRSLFSNRTTLKVIRKFRSKCIKKSKAKWCVFSSHWLACLDEKVRRSNVIRQIHNGTKTSIHECWSEPSPLFASKIYK